MEGGVACREQGEVVGEQVVQAEDADGDEEDGALRDEGLLLLEQDELRTLVGGQGWGWGLGWGCGWAGRRSRRYGQGVRVGVLGSEC